MIMRLKNIFILCAFFTVSLTTLPAFAAVTMPGVISTETDRLNRLRMEPPVWHTLIHFFTPREPVLQTIR